MLASDYIFPCILPVRLLQHNARKRLYRSVFLLRNGGSHRWNILPLWGCNVALEIMVPFIEISSCIWYYSHINKCIKPRSGESKVALYYKAKRQYWKTYSYSIAGNTLICYPNTKTMQRTYCKTTNEIPSESRREMLNPWRPYSKLQWQIITLCKILKSAMELHIHPMGYEKGFWKVRLFEAK